MVIHFVEIFLHNIKYNWLIRFSKTTRRVMAIHIASLSLIARGKQQIRSVITITSKPGTRDPIVQNAKTRDRVPASPSRSQPIPGFSSPQEENNRKPVCSLTGTSTSQSFVKNVLIGPLSKLPKSLDFLSNQILYNITKF